MSTISTASTNSFLRAFRVKEGDGFKDWKKESGFFHQIKIDALHAVVSVGLFGFGLFAIAANVPAILTGTLPLHDAITIYPVVALCFLLSFVFFTLGNLKGDEEIEFKLARKVGIIRSRRTAQKLGKNVIPELTRCHVEARISVDYALKYRRKEQGRKWSQSDSDAIALLLFQNLGREPVILSIINDRDLVTAKDVQRVLTEIEQYPTALWEGAL